MPARSPSEFFIKFLLSKQEHDAGTILRMLEEFGLDGIGVAYVNRLKASMGPRPEPWDPTAKECRAYLRTHSIHDLWFPSSTVQEAYSILGTPNLRSAVESLLISPLRVEEIVSRLNHRFSVKLTPEGLQAFSHYFWNKSMLSSQEWVEYLVTHAGSESMAAQNISVLRASPDVAQVLVPWITGVGGIPGTLNTGTVARRMRDVAFLKVLEIERQPATLPHSKMMKNYMDVIKAAEAEMRQSDVALKDVLAAFEQFHLRKDDSQIPSIEEVAGPNYSQSGQGTDTHKNPLDEYDQEAVEDG